MSSPPTLLEVVANCEEGLVRVLKKCDLRSLNKKLYCGGVLSHEVKLHFERLDHRSHDEEVLIRFLLFEVYESVRENASLCKPYANVISEFDKDIGEILKHKVDEEEEYEIDDEEGEYEIDSAVGEKRGRANRENVGDIIVSKEDVKDLMKLLASGVLKWKEVGMILGLKPHQLAECGKEDSYAAKLFHVINEWLDSSKENCTVQKLKEALQSSIVNLYNLGEDVENFFNERKVLNYGMKKRKKSYSGLVYRSIDIEISSGKSALLGFKWVCPEHVTYEWQKDGKVLSEDDIYSGTNQPFLVIRCVQRGTVGKYTCVVKGSDWEELGDPIYLTTSYSKFTDRFKKVYSRKEEFPTDSWPPKVSGISGAFVNLVLITLSQSDESCCIKGDIDDVIAEKKVVRYSEMFSSYETENLVLIEGRPGCGKTTLLHKVSRDWSLGEEVLSGAEVVLLVPLRLLSSAGKSIELSDLFKNYFEQCNEIVNIVKEMEGEGVCFLIDGLDEYEARDKSNDLIHKIVYKKILSRSMVVVASRPFGSAALKKHGPVRTCVEVLGFRREQIKAYVLQHFKANITVGEKLWQYLLLHTNVLHMCSIPVYAAIICSLYRYRRGELPSTETKIFEAFAQSTLSRKLACENSQHQILPSLECLQGAVKEDFTKVCRLAFDMTIKAKQVLLQSEAANIPLSAYSTSKGPSLGFVTIDSSAGWLGMEYVYTFLHLSFQEYLAACHFKSLEHSERLKVVVSSLSGHHGQMIAKFFCGMVQFNDENLAMLKKIISTTEMDILFQLQCAFESKQSVVCDKVIEWSGTQSLAFKNNVIQPIHFFALHFVIAETLHSQINLTFDNCTLNEEGVDLFLKNSTDSCFLKIKHFGYHVEQGKEQLEVLNGILKSVTKLESLELDFRGTEITLSIIKKFSDGVNLFHLKILHLAVPLVLQGSHEVELLKLFQFNSPNLEQVQYYCNESTSCLEIGMHSMCLFAAFSFDLCCNSNNRLIFHLNSHLNSLPHTSTQCFQWCLKLVLINCNITDKEARLVAEYMYCCLQLETIHLGFNSVSDDGAILLAEALSKCSQVEVFSAHCNEIGDRGAQAILKSLLQSNNPKKLDLLCNPISDVCALKTIIADQQSSLLLACHENMRAVQESADVICECGDIEALCSALKCCKYVPETHLVLDYFYEEETRNLAHPVSFAFSSSRQRHVWAAVIKLVSSAVNFGIKLSSIRLDLSCFAADATDVARLAKVMKGCATLKTLNLRNSFTDSNDTPNALFGIVQSSPDLRELNLSSCILSSTEDASLKDLFLKLLVCRNLQKINLSSNNIGCDNMSIFAYVLSYLHRIQSLDLMNNKLGSNGAISLGLTLQSYCHDLRFLNLSNNNIKTDGIVQLVAGLKRCRNLQAIILYENAVDCEGAIAIANNLELWPQLKELNLRQCKVGIDGALSFAGKMKYCTNLQILNLYDNGIGSQAAESLVDAIGRYATDLKHLDLRLNNIIDKNLERRLASRLQNIERLLVSS